MIKETIQYVPLERIGTDANVRKEFSEEELHGLMQSMAEVGQLAPIRVRPREHRFVITDGERRFRAAIQAGWKVIAAIIETGDPSETAVKHRQLVANCQRSDLSQWDTAEAVKSLMEAAGWNATETAAKLGFSNAKVSRLLALLSLPEAIRGQIRSGEISASAGAELAKVENADEQTALAERVAGGQLTRDGLSGVVKRRRARQREQPAAAVPRITAALGSGRTVTLAGGGLASLDALIAWLEELLAKARKARPKGLELGTFVRILRDEAKAR